VCVLSFGTWVISYRKMCTSNTIFKVFHFEEEHTQGLVGPRKSNLFLQGYSIGLEENKTVIRIRYIILDLCFIFDQNHPKMAPC